MQGDKANQMFPSLFKPGYIKGVWFKNRIVKAATATCLATRDGCVTERGLAHYRDIARGGVGLVSVAYAHVDNKESKGINCELGVSRSEHLPGLQWLAAVIKTNGAKACLQIQHCGRQRFMLDIGAPKAPSRVPWEEMYDAGLLPPEELTFEEIVEIVDAFGDAALRAKQVEFDMVEVHGAHGYLITNFLSPRTNKRTDWYGGSLNNRMRFLLEIIENIRQKVGSDYPLSVRLSGTDYEEENPITIEDTKEIAKALEKAGVDAIHVSGGDHHTTETQIVRSYSPLAFNVWAAEEIKKVVSIPVIASGSITTPELAEEILSNGKADFISLGRPLLADPYFPQKALEGRPEDIAPCIRCCIGCLERGVNTGGSINCTVNISVGREEEFRIKPAVRPKKVAVVGGGPSGMEAARVAALMGHNVTLFEKRKLGGMLIEASVPEFKDDLKRLLDYLVTQIRKTGVKVVTGKATSQLIKKGKFDAVITATGAYFKRPAVPGINKASTVGALDVMNGAKVGNKTVVIGGGLAGCDVALFLAEQSKKVTIIEMTDEIAKYMEAGNRKVFLRRLFKQDVDIRTSTYLEEVTENGLIISDKFSAKDEITCDNVVLATAMVPNRELYDELIQIPELEVYDVYNFTKLGGFYDAIHGGHYATRTLA